jgi:hypothetical protein
MQQFNVQIETWWGAVRQYCIDAPNEDTAMDMARKRAAEEFDQFINWSGFAARILPSGSDKD